MSSLYDSRRHVGIHAERIANVSSTEFPGHYPGEDHSWNLDKFKKVRVLNITSTSSSDSILQGRTLLSKFNGYLSVLSNLTWSVSMPR